MMLAKFQINSYGFQKKWIWYNKQWGNRRGEAT